MNLTPLAPILVLIIAWAATACSPGKTTLQGNENLACSPEVHFISHTVICEKEGQGDWVACQLNGSIENAGAARVTNVIVKMEFGKELIGVRSFTVNLLGDLDPGETADFKSDFTYYEHLSQYDIQVECDDFKRIIYYYFVSTAENPRPEGSVVIMPDTYILAPTPSDIPPGPDAAADLKAALEAALKDARNGWVSRDLEITAVTFSAGHADVVLQGEYFGVGDVTLIAARMQILMTVFANPSVQTAAVTLNGDTIGNLGVSNSMHARPADYAFTRAEIETFMDEHAYASP